MFVTLPNVVTTACSLSFTVYQELATTASSTRTITAMSTIFGSFFKKSPLGFFGVGMGIPVPLNSSNINFSFFKICTLT